MTYNKLTDSGIKKFEENVLEDVWSAMDNDNYQNIPHIHISVGKNQIAVPMHADSFFALITFLEACK